MRSGRLDGGSRSLTTNTLAKSDGVDISMASGLESVGIGFGERLGLRFGLPDPDRGGGENHIHLFQGATCRLSCRVMISFELLRRGES